MFVQSIRFKIILWYMLILALTLGLFSIVLYRNFSKGLYENIDNILQSRVEGVVDSIETYWDTEKLESGTSGARKEVFSKVNNINFIKIAQRWVEEESDDPALLNMIVQIYDSSGKLIAASRNVSGASILTKDAAVAESGNKRHFDTVNTELSPDNTVSLRVITVPVIENKKVAYIAQVASPLRSVNSALKELKIILFILMPLTVFLTGMIGAFLAKIALSPVDKMIDSIHRITADNLKMKVSIPDTKDEIARLADTFNKMLGRLEHSFTSQRQFLENFAHEMKTPLAVLRGEMEVALKKVRTADEYERVLFSGLEEVARISRIVEDLLTLARFDSNAVVLEKRNLDLTVLIRTIVNDMMVLAKQKDIILDLAPMPAVRVTGDENQLKRLFINLLDNAVKYSPDRTDITVSAELDRDYAKISLKNAGAGIPESDIKFIFDRFYRVSKAHHAPGYGLGLSISKSIAEAHGGRIEAVSLLNQGTTFTVYLPVTHI
jgi:heavy metal sensor kinase